MSGRTSRVWRFGRTSRYPELWKQEKAPTRHLTRREASTCPKTTANRRTDIKVKTKALGYLKKKKSKLTPSIWNHNIPRTTSLQSNRKTFVTRSPTIQQPPSDHNRPQHPRIRPVAQIRQTNHHTCIQQSAIVCADENISTLTCNAYNVTRVTGGSDKRSDCRAIFMAAVALTRTYITRSVLYFGH